MLLAVALALALVILLVVGAPDGALPQQIDSVLEGRRELVFFISIAVSLVLFVGMILALG